MNHDELKDKLLELYDGECTPAESREFKAHLASCHECQVKLAEWSALSTALLKTPEKNVHPDFFVTRVMAKIQENELQAARPFSRAIWNLGMVGASLLLMVVGFLPINGSGTLTLESVLAPDYQSGEITEQIIVGNKLNAEDDILTAALEGQ